MQLFQKTVQQFLKMSNTVLPYDLEIPHLGTLVYTQEKGEHVYTKTCMCMDVCSGIIHSSQKVKQLKCPSTDKRINEMCHIYTKKYYTSIKEIKYCPGWCASVD